MIRFATDCQPSIVTNFTCPMEKGVEAFLIRFILLPVRHWQMAERWNLELVRTAVSGCLSTHWNSAVNSPVKILLSMPALDRE